MPIQYHTLPFPQAPATSLPSGHRPNPYHGQYENNDPLLSLAKSEAVTRVWLNELETYVVIVIVLLGLVVVGICVYLGVKSAWTWRVEKRCGGESQSGELRWAGTTVKGDLRTSPEESGGRSAGYGAMGVEPTEDGVGSVYRAGGKHVRFSEESLDVVGMDENGDAVTQYWRRESHDLGASWVERVLADERRADEVLRGEGMGEII